MSGLMRRSIDSEHSNRRPSTHTKRFFTRNRSSTGGQDEAALMERGMADIPENRSNNPSTRHSLDRSAYRTTTNETGDSSYQYPPREPMPPRIPTDVLPGSSRNMGATVEDEPEPFGKPNRSQTQDFEMKKLS